MTHAEGQTAQNDVWAVQLRALRRHLPDMRTTQEELARCTEQLQANEGYVARLYGLCVLDNLSDLHATAIFALEQGHEVSARALARDAIGMAVNAAYVLGEPRDEGVTSALHSHLYAQRKRFTAWQSADPGNEQAARDLESLIDGCRMSIWYALAPGWRTVSARARAVDMSAWVDPALAAASNTEQDAAQGLLNFLQCNKGSPAARQSAHAYRRARSMSDAIYLEAVALRLSGDALRRMASSLRDTAATAVAVSAIERMDAVLADHKRLAEAQRNDQTPYIASFGPFNDPLGNQLYPRAKRRQA
jgi:hypothetical protein